MKGKKSSAVAASGAVALIFLILGFQIAIFTGNVFKFRREAGNALAGAQTGAAQADEALADEGAQDGARTSSADRETDPSDGTNGNGVSDARRSGTGVTGDMATGRGGGSGFRKASSRGGSGVSRGSAKSSADNVDAGEAESGKSPLLLAAEAGSRRGRDYGDSRTVIAERLAKKRVETFEFDPNSVTLDELCRLGFSERQAQVILNYRDKGGRFRSTADFAKMYVVDSAAFARLEPFIRIPKLDLNAADSEALLSLRGIGPYYASKILTYRRRLGGSFSSLDQLLEIDGFTRERLDGFREDVELRRVPSGFNIWEATQAQLETHPYIGAYAAKGIIRFKRTVDSLSWSLPALVDAGILTAEKAAKLR